MEEVDLTPNIGKESGDFFQSDAQLALEKNQQLKRIKYKDAGTPMQWPSKVLCVAQSSPSSRIVVGESAFVTRICQLSPDKNTVNLA